jgi:tetratricopeptide (TPR) repeat protein
MDFYNRGLAYALKDQYDRAIEDFNQAIRLNPNLTWPSKAAAMSTLVKAHTTAPLKTSTTSSGSTLMTPGLSSAAAAPTPARA